MKVANELTARVMGEILSEGMSISGVDLSAKVKSEAIDALCEIKEVMLREESEEVKIRGIEKIMKEHGIC